MSDKLTAVILTHNEQENLPRCLKNLTWCSQILVIDDNSTDQTAQIASQYKAIYINHPLNQNFAQQRNFALTQVNTPWTLFIDADEQVTPELAQEIQTVVQSTQYQAYRIHRKDYFINKQLQFGETGRWQQIRLGRTKHGTWQGAVHEIWEGFSQTSTLQNHLIHHPHASLSSFVTHINFYSTIRAHELVAQSASSSIFHIFAYPTAKFIKNYFFLQGYRDGSHGFVHAVLMALHSFLARTKHYLTNHRL